MSEEDYIASNDLHPSQTLESSISEKGDFNNCICSSKSFITCATLDGIKIYSIKDSENSSIFSKKKKDQCGKNDELCTFNVPGNLKFMHFNHDGSLLLIATEINGKDSIKFFKVHDLLNNVIVSIDYECLNTIRDIKWHPQNSNYILITYGDKLDFLLVKDDVKVLKTLNHVKCCDWNAKGKLFIVLTKDEQELCYLKQYDLNGIEKTSTEMKKTNNNNEDNHLNVGMETPALNRASGKQSTSVKLKKSTSKRKIQSLFGKYKPNSTHATTVDSGLGSAGSSVTSSGSRQPITNEAEQINAASTAIGASQATSPKVIHASTIKEGTPRQRVKVTRFPNCFSQKERSTESEDKTTFDAVLKDLVHFSTTIMSVSSHTNSEKIMRNYPRANTVPPLSDCTVSRFNNWSTSENAYNQPIKYYSWDADLDNVETDTTTTFSKTYNNQVLPPTLIEETFDNEDKNKTEPDIMKVSESGSNANDMLSLEAIIDSLEKCCEEIKSKPHCVSASASTGPSTPEHQKQRTFQSNSRAMLPRQISEPLMLQELKNFVEIMDLPPSVIFNRQKDHLNLPRYRHYSDDGNRGKEVTEVHNVSVLRRFASQVLQNPITVTGLFAAATYTAPNWSSHLLQPLHFGVTNALPQMMITAFRTILNGDGVQLLPHNLVSARNFF